MLVILFISYLLFDMLVLSTIERWLLKSMTYVFIVVGMCVTSLQSCPTLCSPVDCSPPGSPVHRSLQARLLEWVAMPPSRGSSRPRDRTHVSYVSYFGRQVLHHLCHPGSPLIVVVLKTIPS